MSESIYLHKSDNVSVLLYHFVCPTKYRRVVFDKLVDRTLVEICMEISERYEVHFLEIGMDKDHVRFLLQSIPTMSPTWIVKMLKSITAGEIFKRHPRVRKVLWGGAFNTVSKFGDETTISKYVRGQGMEKDYDVLHKAKQLSLF